MKGECQMAKHRTVSRPRGMSHRCAPAAATTVRTKVPFSRPRGAGGGDGKGSQSRRRSTEAWPRRVLRTVVRFGLLAALLAAPIARAEEESPLIRLYDTGVVNTGRLAPDALLKLASARQIPEDQTNAHFAGDAVLMNDKLAVIFPLHQSKALVDVYTKTGGGFNWRAVLGHAPDLGERLDTIVSLKIVENSSGGAVLDLGLGVQKPHGLRLRLTAGEAILELRAGDDDGYLVWASESAHLVIPDFFGDDMVYDITNRRGDCLPAENFCLRLIDGGEAMVMGVWRSRAQEVWLDRTLQPVRARPPSVRIRCLKDQPVWLAFLEAPRLWQAGSVPTNTSLPFPAKWRTSSLRSNGAADSWDAERGPGPLAGSPAAPSVTYPLDRTPATPLTVTCPTDVMRNTLGVGPCQYILACEGMAAQGDPTPNSVMTWVEKQFEQKKEKKAADDIKERLDVMVKHVAEARAKIEHYHGFATEMRQTLNGKTGADPFRSMVDDLDAAATTGLAAESPSGLARDLAAQVLKLTGQENSLAACRQAGERLRAIGATQDRALAKCRMAVKRINAQGRTMLAISDPPADAPLAREVTDRTETMLKNQ